MPITKTPVTWFVEDYICDKCGEGKMRNAGTALLSYPPQYPHTCDKCGHQVVFSRIYPCTVQEEK